MKDKKEFYVYVYIDPRNYEEFYYGKGKGNRKFAHSPDSSNKQMASRIKEIKDVGDEPIIRVIAKGLTSDEALLIEKTLIWKLGKRAGPLTNIATGHFANKFRPHDTFHKELAYFDFKNGLHYVNVSEWHQDWSDCLRLGFVAAGQGKKYSDPLKTFNPGDIIVAYIPQHGYVGVGRVTEKAVRVNDFKVNGKSLKEYSLKQASNTFMSCDDDEKTDYYVKIKWIRKVDNIKSAKWGSGLFYARPVRASLDGKSKAIQKTISFLEKEFEVNFKKELLTGS